MKRISMYGFAVLGGLGLTSCKKGVKLMSAYEITMVVLVALPLAVKFIKFIIKLLDDRYKK